MFYLGSKDLPKEYKGQTITSLWTPIEKSPSDGTIITHLNVKHFHYYEPKDSNYFPNFVGDLIETTFPRLRSLRIIGSGKNEVKSKIYLSRDQLWSFKQINMLEIKDLDIANLTQDLFYDLEDLKEIEFVRVDTSKINFSSFLMNSRNLEVISLLKCDHEKLPTIPLQYEILKTIRFKFNKIKELPENVFLALENIVEIDFGYNRISELPKDMLMNSPNLKTFFMSNNEIEVIPKDFFSRNLKLQKLELNKNKIKKFHFDLGVLKDLKYCYIVNNEFVDKCNDGRLENSPECAVIPKSCKKS